jgi:hypothetical protein
MSTTVGTLEKKVETVISTLSPEELAKFLHNEVTRISHNQADGEIEDAQLADVHRIYEQYVITKDWPGYAKFWKAMDAEDIRYWSVLYFKTVLESLVKQDALITLLLLSEYRHWIKEYMKPYKAKRDPAWKEYMDSDLDHLKGYLTRKREIAKEIKEILSSGMWEEWKLERPVLDLPEDENKEIIDLCEKVESWIQAREIVVDLEASENVKIKKS